MFLTYILVVAIAAFIPYVATPAIADGAKALDTPPAATSPDATPNAQTPAAVDGDAVKQVGGGPQGRPGPLIRRILSRHERAARTLVHCASFAVRCALCP
ncbi:hypothetical protein LJ656_32030 [Paraburkholderia sp. MMS20-SJTR3]|uniref:Uncharacterized protein n=1 Tax=Paraburkholderia sejongensis TaxID=2886946 RepID=A0ABS8K4X2_9BURK|nr:hypothetical protein [Paraburkholderia sp. MMS20-SJTR3]MCC8397208.1 hypothetical protein [Paraburkholderia sp. MMS20-SJTR3]